MPVLDGVSATREVVRERLADVLVLTTFDLDEYVFGALRAGASNFLLKSAEAADLLAAERGGPRRGSDRAGGHPAPDRRVRRAARLPRQEAARPTPDLLTTLTRREREVLRRLGEGLTNAQIAIRLGMAEATVKTHVSRLLGKLGMSNRVQTAILAQELGL